MKTPKTKKSGRPRLKVNEQKIKVGIYLTPDMVDFINERIEAGDAATKSNYVFLCVKKAIKHYKETNQIN